MSIKYIKIICEIPQMFFIRVIKIFYNRAARARISPYTIIIRIYQPMSNKRFLYPYKKY